MSQSGYAVNVQKTMLDYEAVMKAGQRDPRLPGKSVSAGLFGFAIRLCQQHPLEGRFDLS